MGIHGTNPLEGLKEGSKEYLEVKKRLAENYLHHREGEIQAETTSIRGDRESFWKNAGRTLLAVTFAAVTGGVSYNLLAPEGTVDARAKTTCTDLAKKSQTPATPEALSLCEQHARKSIQREDHNNQLPGVVAALFGTVGGLLTIVGLRDCAWDAAALNRRRRSLKGYQSKASETREKIKGLDEQLASLDLG